MPGLFRTPALSPVVIAAAGHVIGAVVDRRVAVGGGVGVVAGGGAAAIEGGSAGIEALGEAHGFFAADRIDGKRRVDVEGNQGFGGDPGAGTARGGECRGGCAPRDCADGRAPAAAGCSADDGADESAANGVADSAAGLAGTLHLELVGVKGIGAAVEVER